MFLYTEALLKDSNKQINSLRWSERHKICGQPAAELATYILHNYMSLSFSDLY